MEKATLSCPRQRVFFRDLFVERYIIPTDKGHHLTKVGKLKVKILEVIGEKALVLLPRRFKGEHDTVLIDMKYIE